MKKYLLLLFCIAAAFTLSASEKNNLTARFDPGFEQGTKFWYFYRKKLGASFEKGKGINNSSALVFKSGTKLVEALVYRKGFVPVKPGEIYTLEAKFKADFTRGYAAMRTNFWSGAVNNQQGKGSKCEKHILTKITESTNGRWSVVRHTFQVPENINGVHFGFTATGLMGEIVFDDVKIFRNNGKNEIPLISKAPALNGKVDPDFMKKAAKLTDFMKYPAFKNTLAADQTEAYIAMTPDAIHGQVLLFHPKEYPIKKVAAKNDSLKVFGSDCIEFFITYTGREAPYYQICINSSGNVYDSLGKNGISWTSGVKTAVGKVNDSCYLIAFSLPLINIGYNHVLDQSLITPSWKMNIGRNHAGCPKAYSSTWKSLKGTFHEPQFFDWFVGMGKREGIVYSDRFHRNDLTQSDVKVKQQVFWPVENKEYESLFSDKYSPLRGRSAFIWGMPISQNMMKFATQYGIEYTREMMFNEYAKANLIPFISSTRPQAINLDEPFINYIKNTKNGMLFYFPYPDFRYTFSALYNPNVRKQLYDWTREQMKKYPGMFWGITLGDEVSEYMIRNFIWNAHKPEKLKKDPYLRAAIKEVKEKYGYGKYGLPPDPKAKARFEWIAIKKYVFAQLLEMQKELYKICQEFTGPDGKKLVCVSGDPIGGLNILQNQTREKEYCDVFTAQCLPQISSTLQTITYSTKILKDITNKEIWPCVHFEPYYHSHTSEITAAYLSEVARGGGTGIHIWNYDWVGQVRKMGCSEIDYYGHRPRWDTMIDIVKRFQTMPLLKYPEPDYAYYLSNETVNSYWAPLFQDCEALFSLLGPSSGTWFKFICGNQLLDKEVDLKKWKTVVIAKADIELPANQQKFLDYVKNGGTLICFDPKVFSFASDGSSTDAFREQLFGAKTVASSEVLFKFVNHPYTAKLTKELISMTPGYALKPFGNTEVLAKFMNNTAAVTMKKYPGGGKAILFASTMKNSYIAQKEWQDLIKQLAQTEGIKTDHRIWNFSFPYKKEVKPVIKDKCYTNNFFFWWLNEPDTSANVKLPGAYYTYSVAPDGSKEKTFSFAKGRLTNRIFALTAGDLSNRRNRGLISKGKLRPEMFADTWIDEDTIKINFDLKKKVPLTKVVIFYNGSLPEVTVKFPNGKSYSAKGKITKGMERLEIKFPTTVSSKVDLIVAQRTLGEKLTISEVEIFGNPQ